jgi:hypothetical protein
MLERRHERERDRLPGLVARLGFRHNVRHAFQQGVG